VPVATQVAAEHRMYLPLAAVLTLVVLGGYAACCALARRRLCLRWTAGVLGGCAAAAVGLTLGVLTFERNADYHSTLSIWQDTVNKAPQNTRAYLNLGRALEDLGRIEDASAQYRHALEIKPDLPDAHYDLAHVSASQGRLEEAMYEYQKTLAIEPSNAKAHNNLGNLLKAKGQIDPAIAHYREASRIRPDLAEAHYNLASVLADRGAIDEAIFQYQQGLKITDDAQAHYNLALALYRQGLFPESLAQRREAIRLCPNDVALLNDTAWMLATNPNASVRNGVEAVELAQRAVKLSDNRDPAILATLAAAYAEAGRFSDAVKTARMALDLARRQNKQALVESINTKIPLYEAKTPFRETRHSSGPSLSPAGNSGIMQRTTGCSSPLALSAAAKKMPSDKRFRLV
jgi:tetratricopeptide (TPR) repeat protein